MKLNTDDNMIAMPVMPASTEAMRQRLTEAKQTVDFAIDAGMIDREMRDFYLGWAYADREGLEVELAIHACGFPAPVVTPRDIKTRFKEVEAVLIASGDVTPWGVFDGSFGIEIEGDGDGVVVLEQTFNNGRSIHPVMLEGGDRRFEFSSPVSTGCNTRFNGVWRLRAEAMSGGEFVARLVQV